MDETARRRWTRVMIFVLLGMTVGLGVVSVRRAWAVKYDFSHFYLDARYLLEHHELNTQDELSEAAGGPHLRWYLPLITILFAPIAALAPLPAGVVWFAVCWISLLATVRWVGRSLTSLPGRDWLLTQAPAVVLCAGAIFAQCHFNQLSFVVLALVAASFALLRRGRDWAAGLVMAAATLIKLVPAVFLLWWLVRRRWRAVGGLVLGLVLLDAGVSVAVFGPGRSWNYHVRWYRNAVRGASAVSMIRTGHQSDYRNQGLGVVLYRLLSPHDPGNTALRDWSGRERRRQVRRINLLNLSKRAVAGVYLGLSGLSVALLAWILATAPPSRAAARVSDDQRRTGDFAGESDWPDRLTFALMCLAMLWFSPLVRQYYLIWCYPAIGLLLARREFHVRMGRTHRWIDAALVGWVVSQLLWLVPEMRSAGINLWAVLLLAIAVAAELRRMPTVQARRPEHANG